MSAQLAPRSTRGHDGPLQERPRVLLRRCAGGDQRQMIVHAKHHVVRNSGRCDDRAPDIVAKLTHP